MNTVALKKNLKKVIELRDELKDLPKTIGRGYTLWEYIGFFRNRLIWVDHGEGDKFFIPQNRATTMLESLEEMGETKFNNAFKTNKTKLIAVLNGYIKDLTIEFQVDD